MARKFSNFFLYSYWTAIILVEILTTLHDVIWNWSRKRRPTTSRGRRSIQK